MIYAPNEDGEEPVRPPETDEQLPCLELLEGAHDFPCPYVFKIIGREENGFVARVLAAVRETLRMTNDPPFKLRQTANGKHIAITVKPEIASAEQVISVYRRVRQVSGVMMLM